MQKCLKNDDYTQKVSVSERLTNTVYIYIDFYDGFGRYGERCKVHNVH